MVVLHQKKQIHQVHNPSLSALVLLLVMPSSGMPNFNRRGIMKKSILIVLASILLSYPISLMGADYETPHEFKSGDTISAEMMNELSRFHLLTLGANCNPGSLLRRLDGNQVA